MIDKNNHIIDRSELVSVIVPIYNRELLISRCIDSILNQKYQNIEVIAIDDGSTDNSYSVIRDYAEKEKKVKCFSQHNSGVSATRNRGIKLAKGRWIIFVDCDDYINPNLISDLMNLHIQYPEAGNIICGYDEKDNFSTSFNIPPIITRYLEDTIPNLFSMDGWKEKILLWSVCGNIIDRRLIVDNDIYFDESLSFNEDEIFSIRLLSHAKEVILTNSPYYIVCKTENSLSSKSNHIEKMLLPKLKAFEMKLNYCIKNPLCDNRNVYNAIFPVWSILFINLVRGIMYTHDDICKYSSIVFNNSYVKLASKKCVIRREHFSVKEKLIYYYIRFMINKNMLGLFVKIVECLNKIYKLKMIYRR